jgi:hypothetical protein
MAMRGNATMTRRYDRASRRHVRGVAPFGRFVSAAARTKEQHDKLTPDDIIALMKQGNERFRLGQECPRTTTSPRRRRAPGVNTRRGAPELH